MMERHNIPPIRTGALTLLLALAAICLAVLAVLSLTTAQADLSLAEKALDRFSQDTAFLRTRRWKMRASSGWPNWTQPLPPGRILPPLVRLARTARSP